MRWEYASPEKNLFLVDGKTAWFYVPADQSVTRVPAKRSADWRTPLALLAGDMKVSRVCSRVTLAADENPVNPGDAVLACQLRGTPKAPKANTADPSSSENQDSPKDSSVFLEVAPDTGNLVRDLDRWLRRRLRQIRWKEWKTTAARRHNLRIRGIPERNVRKWGGSSKGYWRVAGSQVLSMALPNAHWEHLGLKTLTATRQRFSPTA